MITRNFSSATQIIIILLMMSVNLISENLMCQNLVVSTEEIQTVYVGMENRINTNLNCFDDNHSLITHNGKIMVINDTIFWKPSHKEWISYLKIGQIHERDTSIIDSIQFRVSSLGLPEIELNHKERHSGLGNYLLSDRLTFSFKEKLKTKHLNWKKKIKIEGFHMKISILTSLRERKNYIFESQNEMLPKEFHTLKRELRIDDILVIELEKIKINCEWQPETKYYDEIWDELPSLKIK